jgi:hypothetical protein
MKDNEKNNEAPYDFYSITYQGKFTFDNTSINNKIYGKVENNSGLISFQFGQLSNSNNNIIYPASTLTTITITNSNYCTIYENCKENTIINSSYVDIYKNCSYITISKIHNCVVRQNNSKLNIFPSGNIAYNVVIEEGANFINTTKNVAVNNENNSFQTVIRSSRTMEILI